MSNYAFIDGQNLHAGIKQLGWTLDSGKFRQYLTRKYDVAKAYYFIGYLPSQQRLYTALQRAGYELVFKPVVTGAGFDLKGNVDADLVLQAMIDFTAYDRAIIVTGDGDFYSLVRYLKSQNKLQAVLSPNRQFCSALLKQQAGGRLWFVEDLRRQLQR